MNRKAILLNVAVIMVVGLAIALEGMAAQKQQAKKTVQKEQPKMGGTLVFAVGKEPGNPNPFISTTSTNLFVKETSYESLLTRDIEDRIIPNLAKAYEVSAGGTVLTLNLRKGVRFHNGQEMKAGDVLWSANHVREPKNGAYGYDLIKGLKSVEEMDDYTIRFTLSNPSVTFLSYLSDIRMLPIVPANSLQPGQIKLEQNSFIPGTGPFIFEQYQPGFDTALRKFPDYWGNPVHLDKIIFRPIGDSTSRFNALRTGDVQMADRIDPLDAARVKKGEVKLIKIFDEPLGGYQHIMFNYLNPLLQKIEMRQALSYATDKQRLVDEAFFGTAQPAESMMDPKGIWSRTAKLPPHKRDLAKAKAALKAAGYTGQELVLMGQKSQAKLMESYQMMAGEAGIKLKLAVLEAGLMRDRVTEGKYDLWVAGGNTTSDPVITMKPYYYTIKVEKGRYSSPKVDKLIDNLNTEFDQKKRLALYKDLVWTIKADVADIPLLFEIRYLGALEKVQGFGTPQSNIRSEAGKDLKNVWLQ